VLIPLPPPARGYNSGLGRAQFDQDWATPKFCLIYFSMACYFPYQTREHGPVPCGYCPDCKKRRVNSWAFRLGWEERRSSSCFFVTLTYDNANLPLSPNGYMTLHTPDLQRYFKRLRKASKTTIKYLACGEYGSHGARPHYHFILFNYDPQFIGDVIKCWTHGHVDVSCEPVSADAFGYVAGYTLKGTRYGKSDVDDRVPERIYVSRGLGDNYVDVMRDYHIGSSVPYSIGSPVPFVTLPGGVRLSLPRFYKNRFLRDLTIYACDVETRDVIIVDDSAAEDFKALLAIASGDDAVDRNAQFRDFLSKTGDEREAIKLLAEARRIYSRQFFITKTKKQKL